MERIAECCCGQATITTQHQPLIHVVCHCDDCKKRTGSAFGISAYFSDTQILAQTGDMNHYHIKNKHYTQQRSFCANCGTTLYWRVSAFANVIGISAGCFTKQPLAKPHYTVETQNQLDWFNLTGDWKESFDMKILTKHHCNPQ